MAFSMVSWPGTWKRAAELHMTARVVINATGAFCDGVRRMADPGVDADDRAQPGHPPGVRPVVSARDQRDHGAAHAATAA